eukprot:3247238-Rhodomonas_salina.1
MSTWTSPEAACGVTERVTVRDRQCVSTVFASPPDPQPPLALAVRLSLHHPPSPLLSYFLFLSFLYPIALGPR